MPTVVNLASIATSGFLIDGAAAGAQAGFSAAFAGDINGDGFDDIIVGSPYLSNGAGSAYVIYGRANGFGTIDLAHLQTTDGFAIQAPDALDGASVSGAGDVNGDGFDDFVVTSSFSGMLGYGDAPNVYVVFGGPTRTTPLDLTNLSTSDGFKVIGEFESAYYRGHSVSVSSAGDVNGDGFDDIIIGMQYAGGGFATGKAWVVFGKPNGFGTNGVVDLSHLTAGDGFLMTGDGLAHAGVSVTGLGDVNGDGFDDIAVGEPFGDATGTDAGEVFVVFGKASGFGTISLPDLTDALNGVGGFGVGGFVIAGASAGDFAGASISAAGDVNGDGIADILIGAPESANGAGRAYVIFGQAFASLSYSNTLLLSQLSPSQGFMIQGAAAHDNAGFSVSAAGDVNRDGYADIIVGAPQNGAGGVGSGQSYVIFGHGGAFGSIDLGNLAASAGLIIQGAAVGDVSGLAVAGGGDFNGDGLSDVLAGAPFADPAGNNSGQVALVFGTGNSVAMRSGDFNGDGRDDILWRNNAGTVTDWLGTTNGSFTGNFANANLNLATNWQVAGIGDFNGDHRDDILWRDQAGTVTDWLGTTSGGFAGNFANANASLGNDWQIAGVGDFNGDHRDDILWRNKDGSVTDWLSTASGGFTANLANANLDLSTNWHVAGIGDFNGDGRDDILWRDRSGTVTDWLGTASGGFTGNFANANASLGPDWQIIATGDFNGDTRDDILWRNGAGNVTEWLGTPTGGFVANPLANVGLGTNWQVASVGDFNGDHLDDVLWRDNNGTMTDWLGSPDGSFAGNFANANLATPAAWHAEPHAHGLI